MSGFKKLPVFAENRRNRLVLILENRLVLTKFDRFSAKTGGFAGVCFFFATDFPLLYGSNIEFPWIDFIIIFLAMHINLFIVSSPGICFFIQLQLYHFLFL
jgi:hypothetical protein